MNKILITGASSGIGLSITKNLLSKKKSEIVAIARDFSKTDLLNEKLFHPYEIDLSAIDSLPSNLSSILKKHGPNIDTLILSAGKGIFGNIEQLSYTQIKSVMDLNFLANAFIVKTFKYQVGISAHVGYGGFTSAQAVTAVVRDEQVDILLVIVGSNIFVNPRRFSVSVKIEDNRIGLVCMVQLCTQKNVVVHRD